MKRLVFVMLLTAGTMQGADIIKTWNELSKRRDVAGVKALVSGSATLIAGNYAWAYSKFAATEFGSSKASILDTQNNRTFQYGVVAASLAYAGAVTGLDHFWPNLKIALKLS